MAYRRTTYTYDSDGRILTCSIYRSSDAGTPSHSYTYTYTADGKIATFTAVTPMGTRAFAYTYNASGELTQVVKTES